MTQFDPKASKRASIMAECARRGIQIQQRGQAHKLIGIGVCLLCADLGDLSETDLRPFVPTTSKQARV